MGPLTVTMLEMRHMLEKEMIRVPHRKYMWVVVKNMIPFLGTLSIRCSIILVIQKAP